MGIWVAQFAHLNWRKTIVQSLFDSRRSDLIEYFFAHFENRDLYTCIYYILQKSVSEKVKVKPYLRIKLNITMVY